MKISKLFLTALGFTLLIVGCKKYTFDNESTGEAIGEFRLTAPATNTNLVLNSATPNSAVTISWSAAKPGVGTPVKYNWVAALRTGGSLESPILTIPAGNSGLNTSLTLTQKAIDDALTARGIAAGVKTDFIWSVQADNGTTKILSQDVFNISITRFADGATPFTLLGPASSTDNQAINPGSTTDSLTFNWTRSLPGNITRPITYRVWFYRNTDPLGTPLFSMISRNAGADTVRRISHKDFSDSLNAAGLTNLSQVAELRWRVAATSGSWNQWSDFINNLMIVREVRLYLPGSYQASQGAGTDWTPANAPELIRDMRPAALNKIYYTYIFLPANAQFKVTQGRDWATNFGPSTNTTGTGGNLTLGTSNNFSVSTAGVYRISVDIATLKYDVRLGRMGFVGGAVPGNNWTPGNTFTNVNSQMGLVRRNVFIGVNDFNTGGWKMIDNNNWNNNDITVDNARSYGSTGNGAMPGSPVLINDANMPDVATAGRFRVIWDGTDVNDPKYIMNSAAQMRLVGDGINQAGVNDWDPASSPQMTYLGNARWQITIALRANKSIKFLAGNAWGAFDYEDNGAGTGAGVRRIRWDGNDNFSTPATAGTYTIILDEKTGTVSIN